MQAVFDSKAGQAVFPPHMLGALLSQLRVGAGQQALEHNGLVGEGEFTRREREILSLVASGLSTSEISAKLNFSERTIKSVLHEAIVRLNLRNRAHAVAYALRTDAI
jgi:DNA-binding NarL/FixJ family response regulator